MSEGNILDEYNGFCKSLKTGTILYNMDASNGWGEYFLVVNIALVRVCDTVTYTVFLMGIKKKDGKYLPDYKCMSLTPDYARHIPFLKPVGYCEYSLLPALEEVNVNVGLVTVYSDMDLHKFTTKLSIRKPKNPKYGKDGRLVINKPSNK